MTYYVVGFLFGRTWERVVLIKKKRPKWQEDLLNGIGGKIESGETPLIAMRREFKEETGILVEDWKQFAVLKGSILCSNGNEQWIEEYTVNFFYAFDAPLSGSSLNHIRQMTDEEPVIVGVRYISDHPTIPNLQWLIPMALSMEKGERANEFQITEAYEIVKIQDRSMQEDATK